MMRATKGVEGKSETTQRRGGGRDIHDFMDSSENAHSRDKHSSSPWQPFHNNHESSSETCAHKIVNHGVVGSSEC